MKIYNNIEDKIIFDSTNIEEFVSFVNMIREENDDFETVILSPVDAVNYINNYCDNLDLL